MRTRLFFASLLAATVLTGGVASAKTEKVTGPVSALQKLLEEWRTKLRAQAQPTATQSGFATQSATTPGAPAGLGAPQPAQPGSAAQ